MLGLGLGAAACAGPDAADPTSAAASDALALADVLAPNPSDATAGAGDGWAPSDGHVAVVDASGAPTDGTNIGDATADSAGDVAWDANSHEVSQGDTFGGEFSDSNTQIPDPDTGFSIGDTQEPSPDAWVAISDTAPESDTPGQFNPDTVSGGDTFGLFDANCVSCGDSGGPAAPDAGAATDAGPAPAPLPYPPRPAMRLKAIQPDFWPDRQALIGNQTGGIGVNFVWAHWEPVKKSPPCAAGSEVAYDGHCFKIDKNVEAEVAAYSKAGVIPTGIFWGVPAWARIADAQCSPAGGNDAFKVFCAPQNAADFGRFVGFVASRYDGLHGVGRVPDFVIHNEVNSNTWFDIGCGSGKPCDVGKWLDVYAANYNAAYDRVLQHQPPAWVMISLEHHWDPAKFDKPAANDPVLSGQTFLKGFAARVGARKWRVAYHPYPPDLLKPTFDALDHKTLGRVTYGNPGVLVGWLRQQFPAVPSAWRVQFTESGVNGVPSSAAMLKDQAARVCDSLRNVLGTPGVDNYIYHRMKDHPVEVAQGLAVGLWTSDAKPKPAWTTWALANRADLTPPQLSCGFETLPYTWLQRGYHAKKGHWASSRLLPAGFAKEGAWRLLREGQAGTHPLFACEVGTHNLISTDPKCEGLSPLGPVGHAWDQQGAGLLALRRCRVGQGQDHFVSTHPTCEGQVFESVLGWVLPGK